MAAANLTVHSYIIVAKVQNQQGVAANETYPEYETQTFLSGSPVQLGANASPPVSDGYIHVWGGDADVGVANCLLGFASGPASNLATSGAGAPLPFGTIGFPGSAVLDTGQKVPFSTSAVVIPPGARSTDGRNNVQLGVQQTWFEIMYDNSAGTTAANYETSISMVGKQFGLTADANGTWYVDGAKTTAGTNTVVRVVGLNPIDGDGTVSGMLNGRLWVTVLNSAYQFGS